MTSPEPPIISSAIHSTDAWLARNGLQKSGIPDEMRPHAH
jgi:NTE family protein